MKTSPKFIRFTCALFAASCLVSNQARAVDITAYIENKVPDSTPAGSGLSGFEFTITQSIQVTQLGFYAQSIGGDQDTPHVSLYDVTSGISSGTLLYDTGNVHDNVPNEPGWNYFTVTTPVTLTLGHTYAVLAPAYFVATYNDDSTFTYGSAIATPTFLYDSAQGWQGWDNSSYNFTNLVSTSSPRTSANFEYVVVPEPGTYGLALLGFAMLPVLRRLRRLVI